jgi:hypothetical protein
MHLDHHETFFECSTSATLADCVQLFVRLFLQIFCLWGTAYDKRMPWDAWYVRLSILFTFWLCKMLPQLVSKYHRLSTGFILRLSRLGLAEPYIHGVVLIKVFLAGKSPNIRCHVQLYICATIRCYVRLYGVMYDSDQPFSRCSGGICG